jgi:hypothetical protein
MELSLFMDNSEQNSLKKSDVKAVALSDINSVQPPNLRKQLLRSASAIVMALASASATEMMYLENQQMMFKMCLFPFSETGKGPAKSRPTLAKMVLHGGISAL